MTPTPRPFKQVDVFTATSYLGNPLAVVLDGTGLSDQAMQRFAAWTNLSETTFVLPPTHAGRAGGADYRVRIFTPTKELPFAGHPTLGSCHAWLENGGQPQSTQHIVQECQVGLVPLRREGAANQRLAFAAPPMSRSTPAPAVLAQVAAALGVQTTHIVAAQLLINGPVWLTLLLDSPDTVLALAPDLLALKNTGHFVGVVGMASAQAATPLIARSSREARAFTARTATPPHIEVRAFIAPDGLLEDPVTGSLNAAIAQWLIADGHLPERYTATQGTCLGRAGEVHIERDPSGQVWVGGHSVTCISGHVAL
jgi:PhzF family phenazine biosynthesis protein